MKRLMFAALTLMLGAAAAIAQPMPYRVTVPTTPDDEGAMMYMINFDTGARVDSTTVGREAAVFEGEIDEPIAARLIFDGNPYGTFVLEPGSIVVDRRKGYNFGSPLNDIIRDANEREKELGEKFQKASTEQEREAVYAEYLDMVNQMIEDNADNPVGLLYFLDMASQMSLDELTAAVAAHPEFGKSTRVQRNIDMAQRRQASQPGGKMIDFEVTYEGKTSRLSDWVGKGDYVLVDFWASWCGPCIRQTAVLKDIYAKYKDKGLKVLGVAVWDEPEATKAAIKKHELPWESIINAQSIPTDLYGITGIPCIILFGPDGTILSRDKQDDALRADVDAAMAGK